MHFEWVRINEVDESLLSGFDSGSSLFNEFLTEKAQKWTDGSEAVTYVCVDEAEKNTQIYTKIYGFASINTTGLQYSTIDKCRYLNCAEIRMFAIAKQLRKRHDTTIEWSTIIFKSLLQMLYEMSTSVIGFKAIFLNSNKDGYHLYKECGFEEITDFISPQEDEKVDIEECTPLLLIINDDMLYDIFS